jgi:type IV fimbrial biogenesis protein FimT
MRHLNLVYGKRAHPSQLLVKMPPFKPTPWHTRGFTLPEIAVTIAVLAIILSVAVPSFAALTERSRVSSVANEFLRALMLARNQAVGTGERVVVAPIDSDSDWRNGWRVFVDSNNNGSFDAATDRVLHVFTSVTPDFSIISSAPTTASGQPFISFNALGFPRTLSGAAVGNGMFVLRLGNSVRSVCFDLTGRAKVVEGGGCAF